MESRSPVPMIDLLNFEDDQFDGGKYILTSPRSLEACSRLNIKPIEILGRALDDFRDELLPRGLSVRSIVEIYNEYDRERKNKLQLCIEERKCIIAENSENFHDTDSDDDDDDVRHVIIGRNSDNILDEAESSHGRRRRTGIKTNGRLYGSKQLKSSRSPSEISCLRKSHSATMDLSRKQLRPSRSNLDSRLEKITREAENKLDILSLRSAELRINSDAKKKPYIRRSRSALDCSSEHDMFSETGSVASSRLSARSCLTDATYVTDPLLRKKLRGSLNLQTRIRAKDQKILSVLIRKKEQLEAAGRQREQQHIQWNEEKQRDRQERDAKENQRRLAVAKERNKINEIKTEVEAKRSEAEEERRRERELKLEDDSVAASESCRRQQMMKLLKLKEQQIQEIERKKSVDLKLELQRKAASDYQDLLRTKQDAELRRASSLKLTKEQEQAMRTRMRNIEAKERHEEKMSAVQRQSQDDLALLRKSLDFRDNAVERQIFHQRRQKELKLREQQKALERKIEQSRNNQIEIEEEIRGWHKQLADYHHMQETRAADAAKRTMMMKSEKAHKKRLHTEKMQKEKMKQIIENEDQWKREMKSAIHSKQLRIKNLLEDRDKMIQESRNLAGASERLRSRLKEHYSTADLDDLNKKAQIENRILFRSHPKTTVQMKSDNISRLLIG